MCDRSFRPSPCAQPREFLPLNQEPLRRLFFTVCTVLASRAAAAATVPVVSSAFRNGGHNRVQQEENQLQQRKGWQPLAADEVQSPVVAPLGLLAAVTWSSSCLLHVQQTPAFLQAHALPLVTAENQSKDEEESFEAVRGAHVALVSALPEGLAGQQQQQQSRQHSTRAAY